MELAVYGGLFVSIGGTMLQLIKDYYSLCNKTLRIESLPIQTPASIIEEIQKDLSTHMASYEMSFLRRNQVLIEGIVSSSTPIKSKIDPSMDLLYSLVFKKDIFQRKQYSKNAFFLQKMPKKSDCLIRIASGFYLTDYEKNSICEIQKKSNMNIEGALEILSVKTHLINRGIFLQIIRSLIELIRLSFSLAYIQIRYLKRKGAYEGYLDIEAGLKNNSLVTLFGDIIYDVRNKKLVMENPLFIMQDKTQLLEIMKCQIMKKKIIIICLSVPLLLGGSMFVKKLAEFIQKYLQSKREKLYCHIRKRMNELAATKYLSDSSRCNICYDNLRNIILKPCLHMSICHSCLQRLKKRECPICKSEIVSIVEVFVK